MRAPKTHTDIRQDQIARAALDLVAARGVKALQVAEVAKRVGVVPSAIYRHYRSKNDVLDTVLDMISHRLQENIRAVSAETPDAMKRLERLLMRHARMLKMHRAIPSVIFSEELYGGSPAQRRKAGRVVGPYLKSLMGIVREGQRAGRIRPDIRPRVAAMMFLGVIQPAAIVAHLEAKSFDLERHAREAWPILRRGIETE